MKNFERPTVRLIGEDGNAFMILGRVTKALRRAKCPKDLIQQYQKEATSGDYNNLLAVTAQYVEIV